jgi:hypothetical protein
MWSDRQCRGALVAIILFAALLFRPSPAKSQTAGVSSSASPAPSAARIDSFQGPYRFLSNFWPTEVVFENLTFPTVEHAYQAAKTLSLEERHRIASLATPGEAKKEGRKLAQRSDWEQVKFQVMEECVRYKFTHHPELKAELLATGEAELIEGNDWGDKIWGVYQGEGENRLGKILMKIRAELAAAGRQKSE